MSQSHLVLDFPIKAPASAKALSEMLPALMPDFAKTQDNLGTVHFSRFMIKGDEKLLFLSDIDGEIDDHIERLAQSAGPVFDTIFKHVEDPPATPVASNHESVIKWLRHQGGRSCGGLDGQYPTEHLADIHGLQVSLAGLCLETGRERLGGREGI
jgi:hypothetical protein